MSDRLSPLVVAIVAAGLLVVVVGVDVAINRTFALEVEDPQTGTWYTVAASVDRVTERPFGPDVLEVNRSDDIVFRLNAENGYPWSMEESYTIRDRGVVVAEGTIAAPSGGDGLATFRVPAEQAFDWERAPSPGAKTGYLSLEVHVDGETFFGYLQLKEVPS